jgi:hypothetical protein
MSQPSSAVGYARSSSGRRAPHGPGRRPGAMDGASLIFIVMPIVIPLVLFTG